MDHVLIKFPEETIDRAALLALPGALPDAAWLYHAVEHAESYALLETAAPDSMAAALRQAHPRARLVPLTLTTDLAGASAGHAAPWFYVVETDVKTAAEDDFNRWYEEEHLPGLASVPGTVRARRYLARAGSPRYYAFYELATRETFGSPPWLAVRASDWSSRVRPNFINTKRTMFRAAPAQPEA
ncbi:DUF4286 family protein [Bordetella genomosp. 9]|uniref:Uncharacterized protein n=1 Tax=Bordetella genomosp. 9 TaxID=1416803 RepID=A0A1W6Z1C2_9BORD|nr:DUF4286 family protein [Bordetella genomosp. 9]ARP86633.1 hypothetical protein CAL13_10755 [Bordetella genomosp. 9]ARP90632.1 hypothetical protein CAL14_10245 [Bordetella genomosp. 9]